MSPIITMKIHHLIASLILVASIPALGEEQNPFIKKDVKQRQLKPPGVAFYDIVEYISIPADLLNGWLDQNPPAEDASALRKQAQIWITEKKASLIHTLFSAGSQDREASNQNIVEQIYPTEFTPSGPGTWLYPTAFETRNMGITVESSVAQGDGGRIESGTSWVTMLEPSACYHALTEQTRKPGDMFMPRFWSSDVHQLDADVVPANYDPFAPRHDDDPRRPSFASGKTYLIGRMNLPQQNEDAPRASLVIFFRGVIQSGPVPTAPEKTPVEYRVSARLVEMPHAELSAWLQTQEPQAVAGAAWTAISGSVEGGRSKAVADLTTVGRKGMRSDTSQLDEVIYPTEYEPAKDQAAKPEGPSTPTAFETRNTGNTLDAMLSDDAQGLFLDVAFERVGVIRDAVVRRTLAGSEWVPDMTMPVFGSRRFSSTVRPERGKWMLVATGPVFSSMGQPVTEKISLLFIKVD